MQRLNTQELLVKGVASSAAAICSMYMLCTVHCRKPLSMLCDTQDKGSQDYNNSPLGQQNASVRHHVFGALHQEQQPMHSLLEGTSWKV